jgi:hypothetical protein
MTHNMRLAVLMLAALSLPALAAAAHAGAKPATATAGKSAFDKSDNVTTIARSDENGDTYESDDDDDDDGETAADSTAPGKPCVTNKDGKPGENNSAGPNVGNGGKGGTIVLDGEVAPGDCVSANGGDGGSNNLGTSRKLTGAEKKALDEEVKQAQDDARAFADNIRKRLMDRFKPKQ